MGEALLIKAGGAGTSGNSSPGNLVTNIFTTNGVFVVPKAKDQQFSVRIFGGGGGGAVLDSHYANGKVLYSSCAGGGGGYMNNDILILNEGETIQVSIGAGGRGSYISVNTIKNESEGKVGGTTSFGTYLSALGGDGAKAYKNNANGGNGGSGGGGDRCGGRGYQFGGGGGYQGYTYNSIFPSGSGGKWGGGGGHDIGDPTQGGCLYENSQNRSEVTGFSRLGGNGGNNSRDAQNGTNTIGNNEIPNSLQGSGLAGINASSSKSVSCGGGGYGGCGGYSSGGGGGYGANGGNGGGGGGGYGGKGGDGFGGGGGYGDGGSVGGDGGYGAGGGGSSQYRSAGNGGNGICIIQYYA